MQGNVRVGLLAGGDPEGALLAAATTAVVPLDGLPLRRSLARAVRRQVSLLHAYPPALPRAGLLAWLLGVPLTVRVPAGTAADLDPVALRRVALAMAATPADRVALPSAAAAVVVGELRPDLPAGPSVADHEDLWDRVLRGDTSYTLPEVGTSDTRFAVVMVTHDRVALLARALDALEAQTLAPAEVLVVDNASRDGTGDLLRARAARWPVLRVLPGPSDGSVARARNLAVGATRSPVVAFTDDDCRPRPDWLARLAAGFREGIGIVQGQTVPDPTQPLEALSRTQWTLAETGLYETCNIAYTRAALARAGSALPGGEGPFDTTFADEISRVLGPWLGHLPFGEDTELGWRARRAGVRARFAVDAVVEHHVFPPDPGYLVRRAMVASAFPLLVRQTPELSGLLWGGVVLGPRRVAVLGAATGMLLATAGGPLALAGAMLAAPYARRVADVLRPWRGAGLANRMGDAAVLTARDAVETVALLYGSARARRLVL
ncbi:MAG: glycosyltransferase family 2 protein [Mycobacteriales bacterium]